MKKKKEPTKAETALLSLNKAVVDKLEKIFRTAHALAKHNRPFADMTWISKLDRKKGLNIGETYTNDKSCRDIVHAIAETERQKIIAHAEDAKFISVMSDGSSDVSVTENEIIYIHFAKEGIISTFFF